MYNIADKSPVSFTSPEEVALQEVEDLLNRLDMSFTINWEGGLEVKIKDEIFDLQDLSDESPCLVFPRFHDSIRLVKQDE